MKKIISQWEERPIREEYSEILQRNTTKYMLGILDIFAQLLGYSYAVDNYQILSKLLYIDPVGHFDCWP